MNEKLSKILNHPRRVPFVVSVAAFSIGAGAGYILGQRSKRPVIGYLPEQLEMDFNEQQDRSIELDKIRDEVDRMRAAREARQKPPPVVIEETEFATITELPAAMIDNGVKAAEDMLKDAMTSSNEPDDLPFVMRSVFDSNDGDWDYEEELKHRTESSPYILHRDEFWAEEKDYTQTTLSYYAGDNIMADEDDTPVYNYELVTGPLRFGHGSNDPNVVHVRNDKRRSEYEILFNEGLYSEEVLGLVADDDKEQDLKHSEYRKFRLE